MKVSGDEEGLLPVFIVSPNLMRYLPLLLCLFLGTYINAQRIILPNQEHLYPFLNDPSFLGEGQRVQLTGALQLSDTERQQTTKFLNAQVALYDNVAFGLDYYNDSFDLYDYSTIMFSTAFKIGLGETNHHFKLGLSAGGESRKQDSRPLAVIPPDQNFVDDVTGNNLEFTYRVALHYTNRNFTLGGYYNQLPVQAIAFQDPDEVLFYSIEQGYTAYAMYNFRIADRMRLTPIVRYLDYLEDAIYEGAVKFNYADKVEASVSYRNDYSINPAVRFKVIKPLDIGYSYEKAMGSMDFADVHGITVSYKFFKADEEEPEWLRNAKETIEETDQKKERPKKKKETPAEPEAEQEEVEAPLEEEQQVTPEVEEEPVVETPVQNEADVQKPVAEEVSPTAEEQPTEKPNTDSETGLLEKGFYIVVNSFETEAQAEAYMKTLDKSIYFPRMGRRELGGPLQVYIDSDRDEVEAGKRLRAFKLDKNFSNVRLLKID